MERQELISTFMEIVTVFVLLLPPHSRLSVCLETQHTRPSFLIHRLLSKYSVHN